MAFQPLTAASRVNQGVINPATGRPYTPEEEAARQAAFSGVTAAPFTGQSYVSAPLAERRSAPTAQTVPPTPVQDENRARAGRPASAGAVPGPVQDSYRSQGSIPAPAGTYPGTTPTPTPPPPPPPPPIPRPATGTSTATAPGAYDPAVADAVRLAAAPQVDRVTMGPAPTIQGTNVGYAGDVRAGSYNAAQIGELPEIYAQQINAPNIGPVERAVAAAAKGSSVDTSQSDELRGIQLDQIGRLQDIIAGRAGPSAAEMEVERQRARAIAQQIGNAKSAASATSAGLAAKDLADTTTTINQDAAAQARIARQADVESARKELGTTAAQAREGDINIAVQNARLAQEVDIANANWQTAVSQFNAGQINQQQLEQARQQLEAAKSNQAAALEAQKANQATELSRQTSNVGFENRAREVTVQLDLEAQKANQATEQMALNQQAMVDAQRRIADAQNQLQAMQAQAEFDMQRGIANANLQSAIMQKQAELDAANQQFNVSQQNYAKAEAMKTEAEIRKANLTAAIQREQMENENYRAELDAQTRREVADKVAATEASKAKWQLVGGLIGAGGAIGAAAVSDRRAKTDIVEDESVMRKFLAGLEKSFRYRYKEPDRPGRAPGPRYGIMAQDVEATEVGRSFVREDGDGTKVLDVAQVIGPVLASLGVLNKDVRDLKESR